MTGASTSARRCRACSRSSAIWGELTNAQIPHALQRSPLPALNPFFLSPVAKLLPLAPVSRFPSLQLHLDQRLCLADKTRLQMSMRGSLSLATGLGWSDSEDQNTPSLLRRRLSAAKLFHHAHAPGKPMRSWSLDHTGTDAAGRLVVLDGVHCEGVNVLSIASAASVIASAHCLSADVRSVKSVLGYCPDDDWAHVTPVPLPPFTPARRALVLAQEGARVGAILHCTQRPRARERAGAMRPPWAVRSRPCS
jgi:hypothetical protein